MATVPLGNKNVGDTIKLTVGGSQRDFIILHKGSPSGAYQGFDNTVLVCQKEVDPNRQWHGSNVNDYANSAIDSWLNSEYYNSIDTVIRNQIAQVRIPYRAGSGTSTTVSSGASGLQRKVFLLSMYEVGYDTSYSLYMPTEGVKLDYFQAGDGGSARALRIANRGGSTAIWWLRSPNTIDAVNACRIGTNGVASYYSTSNTGYGPRPAFALPSSLLVSDDGSVVTNSPPVINYAGQSDLGTQNTGFTLNYNVTDADNDAVTVTEKLGGVTQRSFNPVLGVAQAFQSVMPQNFQTILNGPQTLTIEAADGKAQATPISITFTKAVYGASITLTTPLTADDMPTAIRLSILGSLPPDVNLSVKACNNGNDVSPYWEDMTGAVANKVNYLFTNASKTAANWGINFRVEVSRGPGNAGGYIYGIEGGFQ